MKRRQLLITATGTLCWQAGCLDRTDDCYMWGLSFEETAIDTLPEGGWAVDGVLRVLFSGSSPIELPYETGYSDVEVLVVSEGNVADRSRLGDITVDEGQSSESDCIDTIVRKPFSISLETPPTRITADCREFADMCDHGDRVREYKYEGDEPSQIDRHVFGESSWDEWDNRERPCDEHEFHERGL